MRAVRFDTFGDLDVLDVRQVEDPLRWPAVSASASALPTSPSATLCSDGPTSGPATPVSSPSRLTTSSASPRR